MTGTAARVCILIFIGFTLSFCGELPPIRTSVAGFINYGDSSDDDINIVITKSLIIYLSKLPGSLITSYDETEKAAEEFGYWNLKELDPGTAIRIAQKSNSKLAITGFYRTDNKSKIIEIQVFVYGVDNGDLKLFRMFKGSTDIGLFDTIDRMEKSMAGLLYGREFDFSSLSVRSEGIQKNYLVYIDGIKRGILSPLDRNFEDSFTAGNELELSIRMAGSEKEVFKKSLILVKDKKTEIVYKPEGTVIIKSDISNLAVLLDGTNSGNVNKGNLAISGVTADVSHIISIKSGNNILENRGIKIGEGDTVTEVFEQKASGFDMRPDRGFSPYYDLLLPGIEQFGYGDTAAGSVFLGIDVISLGSAIISYVNYDDNFIMLAAADPADQQKYIERCLAWRYIFFGSAGLWALNTAVSVFHAGFTQGSACIDIKPGSISFMYRLPF